METGEEFGGEAEGRPSPAEELLNDLAAAIQLAGGMMSPERIGAMPFRKLVEHLFPNGIRIGFKMDREIVRFA